MTDEELIARLREKTVKKLPNNWQKGRKCPDCGSDATRPKCFFDYGPSCARHDPDAYDPPAWEEVPDPLSSAAADRIDALRAERDEARAAWEIEAATVKCFADRHERNLVLGAKTRARAEAAETERDALRAERDETYAYAKHLVEAIFANGKFDAPQWEPLEDTLGVLTQIDNMVAGIRARAALAPDLSDPVTVHANMLRGTIAKPTVEQIIHLYGRDALMTALVGNEVVKPLVWNQNSGGVWEAQTAFGTRYSVADRQWTYGPTRVWFWVDDGDEAAKAAAQADYEARILAALPARGVGANQSQVIAICEAWVADGRGDECFWEGWPDQPQCEGLTPNMVLAALEPNK